MYFNSNDLKENFFHERKESLDKTQIKHHASSTAGILLDKNLFRNDECIEMRKAFFNLLNSALPSIFALFFVFINDTVNLIFAGKKFSSAEISAIGLGTFYVNSVGYILGIGILGGIDTICSHAWGAKQYHVVGLFINTARVCLFIFSLFIITPFILLSGSFIRRLNLEEDVIELTIRYSKSLIPYVFFSLQHNANVRYLQSINIFYPGMIVAVTTAILHSFFCYLVIHYTNLGIEGIGYLMGLNSVLNFSLLIGYIFYINPHSETNINFLSSSSFEIKRIYDFLKLAIPSAIMFSADWIGFDLIILLSSWINNASLATNVVLCTFSKLIETIPLGFSFAATFYIGKCMGSSRCKSAKVYALISGIFGIFIIIILSILLYVLKDKISFIYSNEADIIEIIHKVHQTYMCFIIIDVILIILNGIVKGIGKQKPASVFVIFVLYAINLPLGITLAFIINYVNIGLWMSQLTSALLLTVSYVILLTLLNWETISTRAIIKLKYINDTLKRKSEIFVSAKLN